MSKLEKNTIINIICIVLSCALITFSIVLFFKHKQLSKQVENLLEKIEEQSCIIKKQSEDIEQLKNLISNRDTNDNRVRSNHPSVSFSTTKQTKQKPKNTNIDITDIVNNTVVDNFAYNPVHSVNADSTIENESLLDEELENELRELDEEDE